jgi:hypothetical protein
LSLRSSLRIILAVCYQLLDDMYHSYEWYVQMYIAHLNVWEYIYKYVEIMYISIIFICSYYLYNSITFIYSYYLFIILTFRCISHLSLCNIHM